MPTTLESLQYTFAHGDCYGREERDASTHAALIEGTITALDAQLLLESDSGGKYSLTRGLLARLAVHGRFSAFDDE